MSKTLHLTLLALLLGGCSAGTTSVFKGNYPVMLGPKDRVRGATPLPTTKIGDYRGGSYKESTHDANTDVNSADHVSSLDVEADKLILDDPANELRVESIEAEAWATLLNSAVTAQVVVLGQAVRTGGK